MDVVEKLTLRASKRWWGKKDGGGEDEGCSRPKNYLCERGKNGCVCQGSDKNSSCWRRDERKEGAGTALMEVKLRVFWGSD